MASGELAASVGGVGRCRQGDGFELMVRVVRNVREIWQSGQINEACRKEHRHAQARP